VQESMLTLICEETVSYKTRTNESIINNDIFILLAIIEKQRRSLQNHASLICLDNHIRLR
jgi:hypothetical protein